MPKPKQFWTGSQWMVTNFGLETIQRRGPFSHWIKKSELRSIDAHYIQYLKDKGWVLINDFLSGLDAALKIHDRLKEQARRKRASKSRPHTGRKS